MTTNIVRVENNTIISAETNYQGFVYDIEKNSCKPTGNRTPFKWSTLKEIFPSIVKGSSFMDIGANFGFFCFKALEHECSYTVGIEANKNYYESINNVLKSKKIENFEWVYGRFPEISKEVDVVMALSIVHHLFSKMSLEKIVLNIKKCAKKHAIIEWVDRNDSSVKKYGYDKNFPEYNKFKFDDLLNNNFNVVKDIGKGHHSSRIIYLLTV